MIPPVLDPTAQAQLKAAVQASPSKVGIDLANWNWKVVREFVERQFQATLGRSSCVDYLHRLGFVLKRPKKRLLKADAAQRKAFVAVYHALRAEAEKMGAKIFFVDEAHFRADADLRGIWVLKGEPALVDSTSPRLGEKVTYYSAVCRETGEVAHMEVADTCTAETSAAFLTQVRSEHPDGQLIVIWDNGPAHRGDAQRTYLATPDLRLCLVALPGYSPDFNADEHIWAWVREEVTAHTCFGTGDAVRAHVDPFFAGLADRTDEVKQRRHTELQKQSRRARRGTCRSYLAPRCSKGCVDACRFHPTASRKVRASSKTGSPTCGAGDGRWAALIWSGLILWQPALDRGVGRLLPYSWQPPWLPATPAGAS